MREITKEEFDKYVGEYAEKNWLVKNLLRDVGSVDKWPEHLQADLRKREGIFTKIMRHYYVG